jgi:Domain of unknown function (DUF5665)
MSSFPRFFQKKDQKNVKKPLVSFTFKVDNEREFRHFVRFLSNPWSIAFRNFLAGTFYGLGFLLGTALFLWLLSFILQSILGEIPFLSDFSSAFDFWLRENLNQVP